RVGEIRRIRGSFTILAMAVVAFIRLEARFALRGESILLTACGGTAGGPGTRGWPLRVQRGDQNSCRGESALKQR
ncbi:MAG TPA: hypothetical protein VEL77_06960, partial [Rugosimonospora sp.]|nr:hypothetical protein [Rugosimonospora sp.]